MGKLVIEIGWFTLDMWTKFIAFVANYLNLLAAKICLRMMDLDIGSILVRDLKIMREV